jgi:UDP-glucose 4-epimerase
MRYLITGSSGHLGEALVRSYRAQGHEVIGLDVAASAFTDVQASVADRATVQACMRGVDAVLHTATLHKPHVATHSKAQFVETNISGTLVLLEEAVAAGVSRFIFTSTTSVFGDALRPPPGQPAAWVTEALVPQPRNIYGVTKTAAEDLCALFHRNHGLPIVVLRTSRFFPEPDDDDARRAMLSDANLKVVELLYRRVEVADVVTAHSAALARACDIGFGKFIISATSPFEQSDLSGLRGDAAAVLRRRLPGFEAVFKACGFGMLADIDRVYVNDQARQALGWQPQYDFARALRDLAAGRDWRSELACSIGVKGYHGDAYADGRYPV